MEIALALIGSGALSAIIAGIFNIIVNRKGRLAEIEKKLDEIEKNQKTAEKDELRTQLLMMIADYPDEQTDILRLGEYYFDDLDGNWVASAIFGRWLTERKIQIPQWFEGR